MNEELKTIAKSVRRRIFDFKTSSSAGHLASSLSPVDILVSLHYDKTTVFDPNRDIFIFSKGHGSPSIYPILVDRGILTEEDLSQYCRKGGRLRLHTDHTIPGCHYVAGSLGNGIGYAAGLAYDNDKNIFVLLGDGELYEGSVWEALIFIGHHKLKNMKLIIDRNDLCILGATEELLKLEPLKAKFESFGFYVSEVDGHDFDALRGVFSRMLDVPEVVIAKTVKGKGVSYMEGQWRYHTIIPKDPDLIKTGKEELS